MIYIKERPNTCQISRISFCAFFGIVIIFFDPELANNFLGLFFASLMALFLWVADYLYLGPVTKIECIIFLLVMIPLSVMVYGGSLFFFGFPEASSLMNRFRKK